MQESSALTLEIFPHNQGTFGPCDCCGEMTSRVWGYVHEGDSALAAYYVEWTPGHDGKQANFDLIVGRWGDNTDASDRQAIAVEFRKLDTGPAFRVIDAKDRNASNSTLVSKALDRSSVIGTPVATQVFAICDLIYLEDPRISELRD
jgi:hypothetical protein